MSHENDKFPPISRSYVRGLEGTIDHQRARIAALEAENARLREVNQRPTLDVVIDSPVIGLSMVEELATLRRENARFQWREGEPPETGWYVVTVEDREGARSVQRAEWSSAYNAWMSLSQVFTPVVRWMELPPPFRLTPSESSS